MDLLDAILHPYTAWRYRKWERQLDEKMLQAQRDVNHWMMDGRKIIYTQDEVRERIRENAKALRRYCRPTVKERVKRFLRK